MSRKRYNGKVFEYIPQILKTSTRAVCRRLGVSYQTYARWKVGKIRISDLMRVCEILRTSMYYFITPQDFSYDINDIQLNLIPWYPIDIRPVILTETLTHSGLTKTEAYTHLKINHKTFEKMQKGIVPENMDLQTFLDWIQDCHLEVQNVIQDYNIKGMADSRFSDQVIDAPEWYWSEIRQKEETVDEENIRLHHIIDVMMKRNRYLEEQLQAFQI